MRKLLPHSFVVFLLLSGNIFAQSGQTKVLFIGNSFTYVNDMPGMFQSLCNAAGKSVYIDEFVNGGVYVDYFVNNPTTYTYLHSQQWDYVVYQDNQGYYCNYVGTVPAQVIADNKRLQDSIKAINPCCKVIYFAGWGFQGGITQYIPTDNSVWETQRILDNYKLMNNSSGFNDIIAPIGRGWISALNERPDITLWSNDGAHPAPAGTYIGANVIYTTVFGENPLGNSFASIFNTTDAQYMQKISYHAVVDSMALYNLNTYMPVVTASSSTLTSAGSFTSYQWLKNNASIGGEINSSYVLSSPGAEKYQLEVTTGAGCKLHSRNAPFRDAEIYSVNSPGNIGCSNTINPSISIFNGGFDVLTTLSIDEQIDGGSSVLTSWSGNLTALSYSPVNLNSTTTTNGAHAFVATASNPNNGTDGNSFNNSGTKGFTILGTSLSLPFAENFENVTFEVTDGWFINNPDASITWARTTTAAYTGSASAFLDNRNYPINGATDDLITPAIDLTTQSSPVLTFQVAYQLYSDPSGNPNWSDTLEVSISTDCGLSFSSIYKRSGTNLVTVSPTFSTTTFIPSSQNQWRQESVSLNGYASSNKAILRFRHTSDYENNMYIDDVNISGTPLGIKNSLGETAISVYPNPANSILYIKNSSTQNQLEIYNAIGQLIEKKNLVDSITKLDVSRWSRGIYSIQLRTAEGKQIEGRKIVLE